jgi:SAM-dependent methyltransferase
MHLLLFVQESDMHPNFAIPVSLIGLFLIWQILIRILRKLIHFPAPALIGRFLDSDLRRAMQPPAQIIERSGFKPGMKVIEIGCGSGCYTLFIAAVVGKDGKVYALDIQKKMLAQIGEKIARSSSTYQNNIELIEASAYAIPFGHGMAA